MKKDNRGFSFLIVIFVIVLISIIVGASIVLARTNSEIKKNYAKSSINYYNAESGLNAVRACVQEICSDKLRESYETISLAMSEIPSDKLDEEFKNCYITSLYNYFNNSNNELDTLFSRFPNKSFDSDKYLILTNYIRSKEREKDSADLKLISFLTINDTNSKEEKGYSISYDNVIASVSRGTFTIKNIIISYNSGKHINSITTDIVCKAPIVFGSLDYKSKSVASFMDYALIADRNIFVSSSPILFKGDIYAGNDLLIGHNSFAQLTIDSNKLVTKNNIVVYPSSSLYYENIDYNKSDLYANNIISLGLRSHYNVDELGDMSSVSTSEGDISLKCKTFVMNDTSLDSPNKNVKISGEYYGYGHETSSFNINASNIEVDLTGLNNFWLSGNSYIEAPNGNTASDILTGESLTAKFMQSAYLVPSCCIYRDEGENKVPLSNPVSSLDYKVDLSLNKENGGIDLIKYNATWTPVTINFNSGKKTIKRTYLYLTFAKDIDASRYLYDLSKINKDYFSNRADSFNLGNIMFSDSCILKTVGNVISYDKAGKVINVDYLSNDKNSSFTKFKNQNIQSKFDNLSTTLTETGYDDGNSVFNYLIDSDKISSSTGFSVNDNYFKADKVVYYNGKKDVLGTVENVVDSENTPYRILIVDGDVEIRKSMRGLVIATGNVTVRGFVYGTIISGKDVKFDVGVTGIDNDKDYLTPLNFILNSYDKCDEVREYFKILSSKKAQEFVDDISSMDVSQTISYSNYARGSSNE